MYLFYKIHLKQQEQIIRCYNLLINYFLAIKKEAKS